VRSAAARADDLLSRAELDQLPRYMNADAVGDSVGLLQVVR